MFIITNAFTRKCQTVSAVIRITHFVQNDCCNVSVLARVHRRGNGAETCRVRQRQEGGAASTSSDQPELQPLEPTNNGQLVVEL